MILRKFIFVAGFIFGLLGLAACAHGLRPVKTVYVPANRPTAVSCVPADLNPLPQGLETRGTLAAVPEGPERYARIAADWLLRVARMEETESVIETCRKAAPPH